MRAGDLLTKTHLIDDELLSQLAVIGTPQECAKQLLERFGDHAERVCCYFPGSDPSSALISELVEALRAPVPQ